MTITELRRIAQGLDQMHDLDARIMAIYERGRADERARIVELLRKLSVDARPSKVAGEAFSPWLELDAAADQIEWEIKP